MKTCNHFRYEVPSEDANLLREQDAEPCEVCDKKRRCSVWPSVKRLPLFNTEVGKRLDSSIYDHF